MSACQDEDEDDDDDDVAVAVAVVVAGCWLLVAGAVAVAVVVVDDAAAADDDDDVVHHAGRFTLKDPKFQCFGPNLLELERAETNLHRFEPGSFRNCGDSVITRSVAVPLCKVRNKFHFREACRQARKFSKPALASCRLGNSWPFADFLLMFLGLYWSL